MTSPIRVMLDRICLYYPFGNTLSHNVLEGFNYQNDHTSSDSSVKVLFLGCGDLRNAFHTATTPGKNLQIHLNDLSQSVIARNILLLKVISDQEFNPDDADDFDYLWDVWYNLSWPESTQKRFAKDVENMLNAGLPHQACVSKSIQQDLLEKVWMAWLNTLNESIQKVQQERSIFITNSLNTKIKNSSPNKPPAEMSFSDGVAHLVSHFITSTEVDLTNEPMQDQIIIQEAKNYFETGNCRLKSTVDVCVNPTLLKPNTKQWCVHYSANPFDGYLPLPPIKSSAADGIMTRHCQKILKVLLMTYRKRIENTKFFFHIGDALNFCYEESPIKFDVIDCSNLADHLGLANLLNATSRRLASDRSLLLTESMTWSNLNPSVVQYVETSLCSPLSMIPTLYGLMLINRIELGSESPRLFSSSFRLFGLPARLRWKKLPPSLLPLDLSPSLKACIEKLRDLCFLPLKEFGSRENVAVTLFYYTPLTFDYILSDLSNRHSSDFTSMSFDIPRMFHQTLNTIGALRKNKMVRRVTAELEIILPLQMALKEILNVTGSLGLRLVLVPTATFMSGFLRDAEKAMKEIYSMSDDVHYIDNLDVILKTETSGNFKGLTISFLIEDERLLKTHSGILMDVRTGFSVGTPFGKWNDVEVTTLSHPFTSSGSVSHSDTNLQLGVESCLESEEQYKILLKIHCESTPSGLKVSTDRRLPCESAHEVTVSLGQVKPFKLKLPYPIFEDNVRATLRRKDRSIELVLDKAIYEPWPAEFSGDISMKKWNLELLRPWEDVKTLSVHLGSQFNWDYLLKNQGAVSTALNEVRELIRSIIAAAFQGGEEIFTIRVEGSSRSPNWYVRAHLPVLVSPLGTPILVLSVVDHHLVERLVAEEKCDRKKSQEDFRRLYYNVAGRNRTIWMKSAEEVRLVRYVFRLNSTKILPNRWQTENLPRDEYCSWFSTFVSPLYLDTTSKELELIDSSSAARRTIQNETLMKIKCAKCKKEGEKMKRCSRCKLVVYCSVECQRVDWSQHKTTCFSS